MVLMRTDPFRELDRLSQQVFGTAARPAFMPMDAWREGDRFVVEYAQPPRFLTTPLLTLAGAGPAGSASCGQTSVILMCSQFVKSHAIAESFRFTAAWD